MPHTLPSPLLVLEACTTAASVALYVGDREITWRDAAMGPSRDDTMLPAIADVLNSAGLSASDVKNIACGSGPGGFTGLRIAASLAKGLAVANGALLYAIPSMLLSLDTLANRAGHYLLHSDALRGDRYALLVQISVDGHITTSGVAARMTRADLDHLAAEQGAIALDVSQTRETMLDVAARRTAETVTAQSTAETVTAPSSTESRAVAAPHARNIASLASLWKTFGPVSVAGWEPDYGRLAEAQVKWEQAHGHGLPVST